MYIYGITADVGEGNQCVMQNGVEAGRARWIRNRKKGTELGKGRVLRCSMNPQVLVTAKLDTKRLTQLVSDEDV